VKLGKFNRPLMSTLENSAGAVATTGMVVASAGEPACLSCANATPQGHAAPALARTTRAGSIHARDSALAGILCRAFSFPVLLGALLVGAVFCTARLGLQDPDTWWHIVTGQQILATHAWPTVDSFSFTIHGAPWLPYEWLGDVLMAVCVRVGGLQGLTAGVIVLAGVIFALLYYYAFLRSRNAKAAFMACAAVLPLSVLFFTFRPQLLGYVFFILTLILLERYRLGLQQSLWLLPLVFLLWVNTHGTFVFGLFALGLYWASGQVTFSAGGIHAERWTPRQNRHLMLIGLLCLLALCATPYGWRVAVNPIQMAFAQPINISSIKEWQSMPLGTWRGKLFLAYVLLFVLAQIGLRPRYRIEEMGLFFLAVYAASVHVRFLIIFVIIFAPLLAGLLERWSPPYESSKDRPLLNAALMLILIAALVAFFPSRQELLQTEEGFFPVSAVQYLRAHAVPEPMFNEYGYGGYLIWSFNGQRKVFIDGRADIYEARGVLSDYLSISGVSANALGLLKKYNIQSCLIQRDAALATLLSASGDWSRIYEDQLSAIYVRNGARP
jgi:hypothetical protein